MRSIFLIFFLTFSNILFAKDISAKKVENVINSFKNKLFYKMESSLHEYERIYKNKYFKKQKELEHTISIKYNELNNNFNKKYIVVKKNIEEEIKKDKVILEKKTAIIKKILEEKEKNFKENHKAQ